MTVDEALAELLGDRRAGDVWSDLIMGMNEAMRRCDRNTELGGVVIAALRDEGLSCRDIENATGAPYYRTAVGSAAEVGWSTAARFRMGEYTSG